MYRRYSGNFLVNLLGKWKESEYSGGQYVPVGGLAYYITAPSRWYDLFISTFLYIIYDFPCIFYCSVVHLLCFLSTLSLYSHWWLYSINTLWQYFAAWLTWQRILSMLSSTWSLCWQRVHFSQKLGSKCLDPLLETWLSSWRYDSFGLIMNDLLACPKSNCHCFCSHVFTLGLPYCFLGSSRSAW